MPDDADDATAQAPSSLQPPSLFGRKKKSKPAPPPSESAREPGTVPPPPPEPTAELTLEPGPEHEPATQPEPDPDIRPEIEPVPPPPPPPQAARPAPPPVAPAEPVVPEVPAVPQPPRGPWLTSRAAAVVTGLLVGALIVAATSGVLRVCTEIRGTSTCGGAGFPLLVAILIVAVLLGAFMLRAAQVPEPGSTSFLAVGLLSVVALLFLVDQLMEWWMVIVIPVVSILAYLVSWWVTTTFIEPELERSADKEQPEIHDIR